MFQTKTVRENNFFFYYLSMRWRGKLKKKAGANRERGVMQGRNGTEGWDEDHRDIRNEANAGCGDV